MTTVNWERWSRATGIVFVVLFIVAYIIYGDQAKVGASTDELASFYVDDRGRVLTASVIFGVAIIFFLWFAAAVASTLRDAGQGGWAGATIASSTAVAGVFFVLITLGAGLAYSIAGPTGSEDVIRALNDLSWAVVVMTSFPATLLILASSIGLWRAGIITAGLGWAGLAGAIIVLLGGTTWADDGFWAPDGAYSRFITPIVFLAWIAIVSGLLYARAPSTAQAPERAAVPTN